MTTPDPTTLEAMRRDAAAARLALADGTLDRAGVERLIRYVERLTALREPVPGMPEKQPDLDAIELFGRRLTAERDSYSVAAAGFIESMAAEIRALRAAAGDPR